MAEICGTAAVAWGKGGNIRRDRSVVNSLPQEIYAAGVQLPAFVDKLALKFKLAGDLFSDPLDLNMRLKMRILDGKGMPLE